MACESHVAVWQVVPLPYRWQPPAPSHRPLVPQEAGPWSTQAGLGVPGRAGTQRPSASGLVQVIQVPRQALSQQMPSTQLPEAQSAPAAQAWPLPRGPQVPPTQAVPGAHWSLVVQVVAQLSPTHMDGAHGIATPATQVPTPSHAEGGMNSVAAPAHPPRAQTVPTAYLAHPPCPLQKPLSPQVSGGSRRHTSCGSGTPAGAGRHSPTNSGRAQLTHGPLQARLQHTPSAQKPEAHSVPLAQGTPTSASTQPVWGQHTPATHRPVSHSGWQAHACPAALLAGSVPTGQLLRSGSVPRSGSTPAPLPRGPSAPPSPPPRGR